MSIKRGDVISHCGASQWGVGKVTEVCATWVAIHFNDGIVRKIVSSHLEDLHPADPKSFVPQAVVEQKLPHRALVPKEKKTTRKAVAR
ncbi:DUF3553 domain-containing protein [Geomonas propionica]|uniref:DUF3553 domain-containing protein n=1 Tax=Geomonas propionica TaxID=2798582 RepID=A0ABS0YYH7_9BACT|nr:DUF3553 domain-containing protein [Geomonas propionica]MBJ6802550.1 DUF3553 domain-containing protein [Geomonas propionica]